MVEITLPLGKPISKDIEINPAVASLDKPQAWLVDNTWSPTNTEYYEGWEQWYYNFQWAMLEAKARNTRLPSLDELVEFIQSSRDANAFCFWILVPSESWEMTHYRNGRQWIFWTWDIIWACHTKSLSYEFEDWYVWKTWNSNKMWLTVLTLA